MDVPPLDRVSGGTPLPATERLRSGMLFKTVVSRYCRKVLDAADRPPTVGEGQAPPRTLVAGLDPHRVLLFGSGVCVGYGVTARAQALDGALAALVAEHTRRGVVLENRSRPHVPMAEATASLGWAGTHTFTVGVWSPALTESLERLTLRGWGTQLTAMLTQLRASSRMPLVLAQLPEPTGDHPFTTLLRPWVADLNHKMTEVAAHFQNVESVDLHPVALPGGAGDPVASSAHYRLQAERLLPAVLRGIRAHATREEA